MSEHVGMAPHQLVVDAVGDVGDGEPTLLLGDRRVELDLVQQVAEFLDQVGIGIGAVNGRVGIGRVASSAWMASTTS